MEKSYHSSTLKKSVTINTNLEKTWNVISKINDLKWLENIKTSKFLTNKKRGIGVTRRISFMDGTKVDEIIVKNYISWGSYEELKKSKEKIITYK